MPSIKSNGLALCSLHHKLFDRGAFSLSDGLEVQISQRVNGSSGLVEISGYGGGYHYGGWRGGYYGGGGGYYGGGAGYYGGGFRPGSFLAGYAAGVYNSQY
jgi:hypothetical protein